MEYSSRRMVAEPPPKILGHKRGARAGPLLLQVRPAIVNLRKDERKHRACRWQGIHQEGAHSVGARLNFLGEFRRVNLVFLKQLTYKRVQLQSIRELIVAIGHLQQRRKR